MRQSVAYISLVAILLLTAAMPRGPAAAQQAGTVIVSLADADLAHPGKHEPDHAPRSASADRDVSAGGLDTFRFSSFLGSNKGEGAFGLAVDSSGAVYLTGETQSTAFPTTPGAFQTSFQGGGSDAWVAKLSPDGSSLIYATFLGGSESERACGIAVDSSGAAYVLGWTESADLPATPGAYDTTHNGGSDLFIAKLNASGSELEFATYLGGHARDSACGLAVDSQGSLFVAGETDSTDFPTTTGAFDTSHSGGPSDAFALRLGAAGDHLVYSTFLGSTQNDNAYGIAVDGAGAAYVLGDTYSPDFPVTGGAFDTTHNGGRDWFVVKLNTNGSALAYSTLLGGSLWDSSYALAVDSSGAAWATGVTRSANWPTTPNAFDTSYNGTYDAVVVGLDPAGSTLAYSTYAGGSDIDGGVGIDLDAQGRVYVTGDTRSANFPTTPDAYDTTFNGGGRDAYVIELDPGAASRSYSTFLDGGGNGWGFGVTVDSSGEEGVVAGLTWSPDYPTTPGAYDPSYNGSSDAFVTRMRFNLPAPLALIPDAPNGQVGEWHSFDTELRDPSGWDDIVTAHMAIGRRTVDPRGLTVRCDPGAAALYLRSATGGGWLGPCSPGEPVILSNGIVELDCGQSLISQDGGSRLGVTWRARWVRNMSTPLLFTGYLRAQDRLGNDSGFVPLSTWTLNP
jgi:hypothetical protein